MREGEKVIFKDIPVYDAPAFIADKSLLNMCPPTTDGKTERAGDIMLSRCHFFAWCASLWDGFANRPGRITKSGPLWLRLCAGDCPA